MPTKVKLSETPFSYSKEKNTFFISEKHIPFDTDYVLIHPTSQKSLAFKFTHSDGCEFKPDTHWHYESEAGIRLEVCNDPDITKKRGEYYLNHKLNQ